MTVLAITIEALLLAYFVLCLAARIGFNRLNSWIQRLPRQPERATANHRSRVPGLRQLTLIRKLKIATLETLSGAAPAAMAPDPLSDKRRRNSRPVQHLRRAPARRKSAEHSSAKSSGLRIICYKKRTKTAESKPLTRQEDDMATHHAVPGEIVDLPTWADDLPAEHSKAIAKTREMELARLFLPPGKGMENHHVHGPLVVHCLSGQIQFDALGVAQEMTAGQLAFLPPDERFTIKAMAESLVLVTFVFTAPRAGHSEGENTSPTENFLRSGPVLP